MKIMVVHVEYPPEALEQRRNHALEGIAAGTHIEFSEIKGELFKLTGNTELLRLLTGPQVVEKAKQAQAEGFDAVVPYGGLDLGVDAARYYVDIPVIGMGRSGIAIASSMTTRVGVILYKNSSVPAVRKLVREMGFESNVCAIERLDLHVTEMVPDNEAFKRKVIEEGRRMVRESAVEAIVPLGTSFLPNNAFAAEVAAEVGVPFINCVTAGIKMAEVAVSMGLKNSRVAYPISR
jgi:allantoin racemase